MHWTIQYSAAGATGQQYYLTSNGTTTATLGTNVTGVGEAANTGQVATTNCTIWIKGIVVTTSNAGNITVQTERDGAGTSTVYIGSRMTVTLLA